MSFDSWESSKALTFAAAIRVPGLGEAAGGLYTTNGAGLRRSAIECLSAPLPDLFCFALLGLFGGYLPGYSAPR